MNLIQMLMSNPNQIINKALGNNPVAGNLVNLVNNKDGKGIEQLARNLAKEKGVDADKMFNQVKNNLGM